MKGRTTYTITSGDTFAPAKKRRSELAKKILDEATSRIREKYDKLVAEDSLPDGQFDSFNAGYGLCLLEHTY